MAEFNGRIRVLAILLDYQDHTREEFERAIPDAREVTRRMRELRTEEFGKYPVVHDSKRGYRLLRDAADHDLVQSNEQIRWARQRLEKQIEELRVSTE